MKEDTNVTTVVGRLIKDAELKSNAFPIGFFSIAVNRKKKDDSGNFTEEASFFDVNVFGKYAETIIERLKKGTQVSIVGSLKQERWTDASGKNQNRVMIIADKIQILGNSQHS